MEKMFLAHPMLRVWLRPPGRGVLRKFFTGMLKVDFRMLTTSIPVYCKKKKKKNPITIPHLYD